MPTPAEPAATAATTDADPETEAPGPAGADPADPDGTGPGGAERDLRWYVGADRFKLRVAAVLRDGDRIAVCRGPGFCYLPGGKARLGESAAAAARRELAEETGLDLPPGPLSAIVENFYFREGATYHELCFHFPFTWPAELPPDRLPELAAQVAEADREHYAWLPIADLAANGFEPLAVVPLLAEPADPAAGVRHLVIDRRTP